MAKPHAIMHEAVHSATPADSGGLKDSIWLSGPLVVETDVKYMGLDRGGREYTVQGCPDCAPAWFKSNYCGLGNRTIIRRFLWWTWKKHVRCKTCNGTGFLKKEN